MVEYELDDLIDKRHFWNFQQINIVIHFVKTKAQKYKCSKLSLSTVESRYKEVGYNNTLL